MRSFRPTLADRPLLLLVLSLLPLESSVPLEEEEEGTTDPPPERRPVIVSGGLEGSTEDDRLRGLDTKLIPLTD